MTGTWEKRLQELATAKADVVLTNASVLQQQFDELDSTLSKAAAANGLEGQSGDAATQALQSTSHLTRNVNRSLQSVQSTVERANRTRRDLANAEIGKLDDAHPGELSPAQAATLQAAVTGATFMFGPLSIVAGPSAVSVVNQFLAANRESAAKAAVQRVGNAMDDMAPTPPPVVPSPDGTEGKGDQSGRRDADSPSSSTPGGYRPPSFHSYPDAHIDPLSQVDTSGVISFPFQGGGSAGTGGTIGGGTHPGLPGTGIDGSITPDGPISGGTTHPGGGSGGAGFGGSAGGGLGSVPGLAAGAGGALALGGAKLVAVKGGAALGGGLSGARGGLLGAGGAGAKTGGLGAAAEASAARTAGLNGAAASRMGSGGLLGSGAQGAAGEAGAGAARGGAGMMGGAPAQGGRDEGKRQGRGLGGPIAPKLEEDQERGPRSAAAGPGGRA